MENKRFLHEYLGITIDYSIPQKLVFTMFDYLEDVIVEADKDLKNSCLYYPGSDSLMKMDYNLPSLPTKDAKLFHHHVARLLFVSKRTRPDIQVCVEFLCTRVKAPTEQDYKNLGKVINYLKETVHLPLVVGAEDSKRLTWNINASFAVYPYCKNHNGACLTLGHDSILSISTKQKINTKRSTEAELVKVDDAMTFVMWIELFFESQVQSVDTNFPLKSLGSDVTIEQDNTSVIQLERNRWKSSSKRTKHINARYFYITDRLKARDMSKIIYKPTGDIERDCLSRHFKERHFTLIGKLSWDKMESTNTCFMKNNKMIKITTSDIVSSISPLYNKYIYIYIYIYIYKCVRVC